MHFIDEAKIYLKAGDGGNGIVSFRREKFVEFGGPNGGNGGSGGHIIIVGDASLNTLIDFRYKQHFKAQRGENGKGSSRSGKSGKDLIIHVPLGTQVLSEDGVNIIADITEPEEKVLILRGGKGGLGNENFKSSRNRAPRKATLGELGDEIWVWLKLKLLSDVGLIGLPNAGKSTFLSVISAAKPKIADYPFTTLTPNLGVVRYDYNEFVIADIPGLIQGASQGHGLGIKFLKHIERCKILLHLIDATEDDIIASYETVIKELSSYNDAILDKKSIVVLNKIDMLTDEDIVLKKEMLQKHINKDVITISGITNYGINKVVEQLFYILSKDSV